MGNRPFTPKNNVSGIYVEKLEKYLEYDKVELIDVINIGLLGGYATGKSSILETLENRNKEKYTFIKFSSAIFLNKYEKNKDRKEESLEEENQIIEKNSIKRYDEEKNYIKSELSIQKIMILQLLEKLNENEDIYYINDDFNIKRSFNNILNRNNYIYFVFLYASIFTTLLFSFGLIKDVDSTYVIYFLLLSIPGAYYLTFSHNYKVSKIKMGMFEIENNSDSYREIISKEADLILEMLKEIYKKNNNKDIIVIIEDIDRYNNQAIFDIFYNISEILRSTNIKIKFIYAVNPEMFDEVATKYFDSIIDVQSFYDKYTSGENFINELEKIDKNYSWDKIFLRSLSFFIPDYRDMLRILNLFEDYNELYPVEKKEMILSIATIKSLYPKNLLLKCGEKGDDLEELLELLEEYTIEEGLEFKESIKMVIGHLGIQRLKTETEEKIKRKIKKMKNDKNKLYEITCLCIESGYLTADYWWFVSPISKNFSYEDNKFLSNYLSKTSKNSLYQNISLNNISEMVSRYIAKHDYVDKIELLNISLIEYLIKEKGYEFEFNKLLVNFLKNKPLLSKEQEEKINHISFDNRRHIMDENSIHSILSNVDEYSMEEFKGFNLFLLIEKVIEFNIFDSEKFGKILENNIRSIEEHSEELLFNGIEDKDFLNLLKEYNIKTNKKEWLEEEIILNNNLFEINYENIEKVYKQESNRENLFDYLYENIDTFFQVRSLEMIVDFLKNKEHKIIEEDKEIPSQYLVKTDLNYIIKREGFSEVIKNKIIDNFIKVIEVNENWKIEQIDYAIQKKKKFYYEQLKGYKDTSIQELEKLRNIIDHLLKYPFSKTGEIPNENGEIRYIKGIKEDNVEILSYILNKIGEGKITFEEYKDILYNNLDIIDKEFIDKTIYRDKFKFIDILEKKNENKRVEIPEFFKGKEEKRILKKCFTENFGIGNRYITKLRSK